MKYPLHFLNQLYELLTEYGPIAGVKAAPVEARYFRFTALHDLDDNGWVGAAEITVVPAE